MNKFRIAYFSPLSPIKSGLSDHTEELLPYLADAADIELFVDGYTPSNPYITENFAVHDWKQFPSLAERNPYDIALYHMGNHSIFNGYIYLSLLKHPGVVVLHDGAYREFFAGMTIGRGNPAGYPKLMAYEYGATGEALAKKEATTGLQHDTFLDYPLIKPISDLSLGIITHSIFVKDLAEKAAPGLPVRKINLSQKYVEGVPVGVAREKLGIDPGKLVFSSFGIVAPSKGVEQTIACFARLVERFPNAHYYIVGDVIPDYDIKAIIRKAGLENNVTLTGFVEIEEFNDYIAASDICVNLRYGGVGETSGSIVRIMGAGKPVITTAHAAFDEFPDETCLKVCADPGEVADLFSAMERLAGDAALRESLGARARQYMVDHHSLSGTAKEHLDFLEELAAGEGTSKNIRAAQKSISKILDAEPRSVMSPDRLLYYAKRAVGKVRSKLTR